jgi:hypothetical protein
MLLPARPRAAASIQRMASAIRRSAATSTGTWYVAPPTRRGLTSICGATLRSAWSNTSIGSRLARASTSVSVSIHHVGRHALLAVAHHPVDKFCSTGLW